MNRKEAITWVLSMTSSLRLSQAKTLAELVVGAVRVGRVSLANIARWMSGSTSVKHRIKRVWRFTSNPRIEPTTAMEGLVSRLVRRPSRRGRTGRRGALVVSLDWTDLREFKVLMASADIRGRSVPLVWATYRKWEFYRSQNNLEEGLLRRLKTLLPAGTRVILLADRGFGRTELARTCQALGFHYLIRINPDVWVDCERYRGNLQDYPVRRGMARVLEGVRYRKHDPVEQNVVIRWKGRLPKHRDECWFLMTDLSGRAEGLSDLYARRMRVEQLFRDDKNRRNGWALRNLQVSRPERVDRLLLVLAFAYVLLCGIGLYAWRRYDPSTWCSNTRAKTCRVFTIGRFLLMRLPELTPSPPTAFREVIQATHAAAPNWG